ncbi:MAG: hypothetical protein WBG53_24715 [Rhodococcus sp. (in: high G+C Gram-positive bacteria)]|uniref:hypothetical protein n=2 Tax=unclassified Rhodococcus (in: high G+C Gram-positive bacteria) TaxID=192944 RepID=UPI000AFD1AAB|nr:hypothetical protein [Rhodococcus sp. SBT000017]
MPAGMHYASSRGSFNGDTTPEFGSVDADHSHSRRAQLLRAARCAATFLLVPATVTVLARTVVARAGRTEGVQHSTEDCSGCGLVVYDGRRVGAMIAPEPGWTVGDDEQYCPDCSATRFHTWGYT